MDEDIFRFVAVRDPQRAATRRVHQVQTWDPGNPTAFVLALKHAAPGRAAVVVEANRFLNSRRFTGSPGRTAGVVRAVDARLQANAAPAEVARTARVGLIALTGATTGAKDADLLTHPETVQVRCESFDSYLAAIFGTRATERERVWLDRVVTVWSIIGILLSRPVTADELTDLLLHAVVVLPDGVTIDPVPLPIPTTSGTARTGALPATLQRYIDLRSAWEDVREAILELVPIRAVDPAVTDLSSLDSSILAGKVAATSDATLVREGILFAETALIELPTIIAALANSALLEHLTAVTTPVPAARRAAVVAEIWRRRGVPTGSTSTSTTSSGGQPGIGRLLKAPVIGDLKVVRQKLAGYELGEFAHVENLLPKEHFSREHEVVDMAETELATVDITEETHLRDLQTTTRAELSREVSETVSSTEAFNVGGTITASYGPYFSATVTGGYATSNARTESTTNSQQFSRNVVERATDNIVKRSESYRRSLTRHTVTEKNTHTLTGPDDVTASAVYRWVNKRYCAQVFDYGLRVLLEIGVPDPAVYYRWATTLGGDIEVDVDPPPALTDPLGGALSPAVIDETNWQALSARFRVADFPAPPAYLITSPDAFAVEPPQAPASSGGPAQAVATYKVSKELKVPGGYQPLCFVAGVLTDGIKVAPPTAFTALQKFAVRSMLIYPPASAEAQAALDLWLDWDPSTPAPNASSRDLENLQNVVLPRLLAFEASVTTTPTLVPSLRYFMMAITGTGAVTLTVGTTIVAIYGGAVRVGGGVTAPRVIGGGEDTVLPVAYATQRGVAGAAVTIEVLSSATAALRSRWQLEAYNAILSAHASWEADFRSAVAQSEIQAGIAIEGRNPLENASIVTSELKRAVIAMLGGVSLDDLVVVTPGDTRDNPVTAEPTPPKVDVEKAAIAGRVVQFYEQAFEWQNMSHVFYPYFWTGRSDWPDALTRRDPDPLFQDFLRAGSARIVLPVRRGWEKLVGSRLRLQLPPWPKVPEPSTSPLPSGDPFLEITEEIREAEDRLRGGVPAGPPWPVILPTTLVAFDATPMPTYPTACDPPAEEEDEDEEE